MTPRFVLCCILAFGTRLLADQPEILGPAIFAAEGGAAFARISYRNPDEIGKYEAYGTVCRLNSDGTEELLWRFDGIHTCHKLEVFLCVDMAHLVVVMPNIAGQEPKLEDWGIAFYDQGRLLKQYAPSDLVINSRRLVRSTASYYWLARNIWSTVDRPSGMELGFWPARSFWLRTIDGVLYEFDSYTGGILKQEPNQSREAPHSAAR